MRWNKSHIVYIDVRWLALKIVVVILVATALTTYLQWTRVNLIEFESTDLAACWQITDGKVLGVIQKALGQATPLQGDYPRRGGVTMRLISQRTTRIYIFTEPNLIYDPKQARWLQTPESLNRVLSEALQQLRKRSPFGETVEWAEVQQLFPVGSEGRVTDLDSKGSFVVRRNGGYSHADIEPLKPKDSLAAKQLYGGIWSWKRRAVILEAGGRKIAASLTGMPQGKGELKDNDCNGSLGLYFSGQAMEKSGNLSHLIMLWKAAGKTREKLRGLTPEQTLLVFFTAVDQRDMRTLEQVITPAKIRDEASLKALKEVIGVTVVGIRKQAELTYQITASVSMLKGPYNQRRQLQVRLYREQEQAIYQVDRVCLAALLQR